MTGERAMGIKRAVKWVVHKATIRAKKRLSDTGMSIAVETPQRDELPLYQEALDFRVRSTLGGGSRGFPVSLRDSERFAKEILKQVAFVRKRVVAQKKEF